MTKGKITVTTANPGPRATTSALLDPSMIRNKQKRQEIVARREQLKKLIKKKANLRRKREETEDPTKKEVAILLLPSLSAYFTLLQNRLKKNVPKTLENTRELDETVVQQDDQEVFAILPRK